MFLDKIKFINKIHLNQNLIFKFKNQQCSKYSTTNLLIYDNLTKKKEKLNLNQSNVLYWYNCGPTVYDSAHIGHASCYMSFDIIKRVLKNYFQIQVVDLLNITDIDDKIINRAIQENKSYKEVASFYENEFLQDLNGLNIEKPSIILRVTDYIPQIIKFIEKLIHQKQAYVAPSGSVYFNTREYPKRFFSKNQTDQITIATQEESVVKEKLNQNDFVLWKARNDNEPNWSNPFSSIGGRPGWHIECSTLATIAFENKLDIHSGGKDLIFPHHENEIIQCCAFNNSNNWSKLWIHYGHLHLTDDVKMSKSLKNTISIGDLLKMYKSDEFRLFCLLSHYRYDKEYSDEIMKKPIAILKILNSFFEFADAYCNGSMNDIKFDINEIELFSYLEKVRKNVDDALNDDINTNLALNEILNFISYLNKMFKTKKQNANNNSIYSNYGSIMACLQYIRFILNSFGLKLDSNNINDKSLKDTQVLGNVIEASINFRKGIRILAKEESNKETKIKLLKICDEYREDLKLKGNITLKDYKDKTTWTIENFLNKNNN